MKSHVRRTIALLVFAAAPVSALAQGGEALLTGKVTSTAGAPVAGAQVFLDKMGVGTETKDDGTYRLLVPAARATGQPALLTVHIIGFKPKAVTISLTPGSTVTDFALEAQAAVLQTLVVTGEGTITAAEKLGATINTVSSQDISKSNETSNLTEALAAKAPNVQLTSQSGDPGSSVNISIRGLKTLTGDGQPLFIVDGIPVDNSAINVEQSFVGNAEQGSVAPNRIADINPSDVESVTILKGSAAAAIYGARAAQGVVLITTKSGKAGPTRYGLSSSVSFDHVSQGYPLETKYGQGDAGVSQINPGIDTYSGKYTWGPLLPAGTKTYDHFAEMFQVGHVYDNNLTVSGGDDRRSFYLSGGINNNQGFVFGPNDDYKRSTMRLKATQLIGDHFKLGGNVSYIDTRGSFVQRGDNVSGIMLGGLRTPPEFNNTIFLDSASKLHRSYRFQHPSAASQDSSRGYDNPFFVMSSEPSTSSLSRVLGNIDINWEPADWLKVQETAGGDYYTDQRLEVLPKTNSSSPPGYIVRADFNNYVLDHNLIVIASHTFSPILNGTLTVGQNLNSTRASQVYVLGTGLITPTPYTLTNTISYNPNDNEVLVHGESYFGQATTDLWDQLFLTGAIRNDGFSTFAQNSRRHWFPKASFAWTFSKLIGTLNDKLDFGKVRFAYGVTGREPIAYSTLSNYNVGKFYEYGGDANGYLNSVYMGNAGLNGPDSVGSDSLRPERTREYEAGLDFGVFKGWADFGVTYYDSKSSDVIFQLPTPPSSGSLAAIRNAATISNKGYEVTANFHPIRTSALTWDLGLVWGRNRNKVESILGATEVPVNVGTAIVSVVARTGYPIGSVEGHDFVRCGRGLTVNSVNIDQTEASAGGCLTAGKAPANGALYIGANGFPTLDEANLRILGSAQPDWAGSIRSSVRFFKRLEVSALLDIKHGSKAYDGTRGALYVYGTHKDTEIRNQVLVFGPSANGVQGFHGDPAVAGPGAGTPVVIGQQWFQGDGGAFSDNVIDFMEDAGYTKLREISVAYSADQSWVKSIGLTSVDLRLSGRNLHTWTRFRGIDPESNLGGVNLVQGVDWFNNPQTRSFVISVGLNR